MKSKGDIIKLKEILNQKIEQAFKLVEEDRQIEFKYDEQGVISLELMLGWILEDLNSNKNIIDWVHLDLNKLMQSEEIN